MGSVSSPNASAPYPTQRDCPERVCSTNCPQWCDIVFPPPPSPDDSGTTFSPLIIAVIVILGTVFLLIIYFTLISKYFRRRANRRANAEEELDRDLMTPDPHQWQAVAASAAAAAGGLDEALIKSITVFKYKKGDGLVEDTDCVVCLNEFQENESLRLMPNCNHAFHLPCIDPWLISNPSCPICRSLVFELSGANPSSSSLHISSLQNQRPNDVVLVVDDLGRGHHEQGAAVVTLSNCY